MNTEIQKLDKTQPLPFVVKAMETLEALQALGVAVLGAQMAPKHFYEALPYGKPDYTKPKIGVFIAVVMHGHELGLSMSAAMQDIVPVHGRMSIMGDAAKALVFSSGLVDVFTETITGSIEKEDYAVTYYTKRKDGKEFTRTFSVALAKRAALWVPENAEEKHKFGAWYKYPDRMIIYRALGFILRDAYPEPLKGTSIYEEMLNSTETIDQEAISVENTNTASENIASKMVKNATEKVEQKTKANETIEQTLLRLKLAAKANGFITTDGDLITKLAEIHKVGGDEALVQYVNELSEVVVNAVVAEAEAIEKMVKMPTDEYSFPFKISEVGEDKYGNLVPRTATEIKKIRQVFAEAGMTKENVEEVHTMAGIIEGTSNLDLCEYSGVEEIESVYKILLQNK